MSIRARSARRLSAVVVLAVGLATLTVGTPAAVAGTTYSAPLRTAVRQLPVAAEDNAGYDRERGFGGWTDADGDCQSTRHEVLIAESRVVPTFSASGCTVTAGQWRSFYDGLPYTLASELQIDHLVPLAEAWGSGARSWTRARRVAFANDLGVGYALNAMPGSLNASKSARGPESWMPPVSRCRYIEVWTAVKHRWQLSVDQPERDALISYADACPNSTVTVATVRDPAEPSAAPRTIIGPTRTARGATATVAGAAAAGAQVQLWSRKQGQPSFSLLRTLTADGAGRWAVPYRAEVDQVFYAVTGGARTRSVTVRAVGTTVTSPAVVRRGARVVLRGLARPGARVDVFFRAGGTSAFVDRRDLVAAGDGAWSTSYVADRDYAVYAASAEGRSAVRTSQVAYATISGPARVARGALVTLTGTARPGARVTVLFRRAGTTAFVQRRSLTASSAGRFRTTYRADVGHAYYAVADTVRSSTRTTAVAAAAPSTRPPTAAPARPADRDCADFATWTEAQAFYDAHVRYYGDVARLDGDGDGVVCERLPGAPS